MRPGADGAFEMYDGSRFEWQQAQRRLRVSGMPSPRWIAVRCMAEGLQPVRVETSTEQRVELVPHSLGGQPEFMRFYADPAEWYSLQY